MHAVAGEIVEIAVKGKMHREAVMDISRNAVETKIIEPEIPTALPGMGEAKTNPGLMIRLREPKLLMATGISKPVGRSNRSALPPPGLFIMRSATSVISR